MNGNVELLNFVYQNSQMGVETIKQLIGIVEDKDFKQHLDSQYREYEKFHSSAREMLNEKGFVEKGIGAPNKIMTYLMINMQTLTDKTSSHISEMLITGSTMGVIDAIKKLKEYKGAEPKIRSLMDKLLKMEEDNIQQLKRFL